MGFNGSIDICHKFVHIFAKFPRKHCRVADTFFRFIGDKCVQSKLFVFSNKQFMLVRNIFDQLIVIADECDHRLVLIINFKEIIFLNVSFFSTILSSFLSQTSFHCRRADRISCSNISSTSLSSETSLLNFRHLSGGHLALPQFDSI